VEKVIILQQNISDFLENLVQILFDEEYFGFREQAQTYVRQIYDFIEFELVNFPFRKTPEKLLRYGSNYVFYKANNRTTWYVFFEQNENRYLITYITNNHVEDTSFLVYE